MLVVQRHYRLHLRAYARTRTSWTIQYDFLFKTFDTGGRTLKVGIELGQDRCKSPTLVIESEPDPSLVVVLLQ